MEASTKSLLDQGRFEDAVKHAQFANLMRKGIDINWGLIIVTIGVSLIIIGLVARIIFRFLGYEVD